MKYVSCNLCGHDDWRLRLPATADGAMDVRAYRCTSAEYGRHPQIVECRHCGHIYANPRPEANDLLEAYVAVEDDMYLQERAGRELTFRKHLRSLEGQVGPARGRHLLDVGAYIGVFVEVAQASGWRALGVEPSAWAVDVGRGRDLPLIHGTLDAPQLQEQRFDVVTMWDVIEHLADPAGELVKVAQLLRPGGYVAVHTMDIRSLTARLMGSRWPWLMEMHLHYFSRNTLAAMLRNAGFDIVWTGTEGRYLRLGYLASRVTGLSRPLGRVAATLVRRLGLAEHPVSVNFGDLFTIYARRPTVGQ